jgi:hypothetical protein
MARGSAKRRYIRHEDVVTEAVGNELLLVQLEQGSTFQLNWTGRAIWELAVGGLTAEEIADRLHSDLGVSAVELERDSRALLEKLAQNTLLEPKPEATR